MRALIARLTPYVDAGSGFWLWQILLSISAGFLFQVLRNFTRKPATSPVDPQNSQRSDSRNR